MSDPLSTARTARESLARGLNALQADPTVPSHLVDLAAPIAQAMGALHQIERTNQIAPHAEGALTHVRGALSRLQASPENHPAVSAALEAVAKSLSLVHSLSKLAGNGPLPQGAPQQQGAGAPASQPMQPPQQAFQPPPQQAFQPPPQQAFQPPPQQTFQPPPQQTFQQPAPTPAQPMV
ncbi:MAG TPA: hypothetical protein VM580_28560, partial [Labilithrix sp.]|nr:hypothetical protein [Labilithrix sp.]